MFLRAWQRLFFLRNRFGGGNDDGNAYRVRGSDSDDRPGGGGDGRGGGGGRVAFGPPSSPDVANLTAINEGVAGTAHYLLCYFFLFCFVFL